VSKKTTIRDIAKQAGVSYQTVSRVINNRPDVAKETRLRVEQTINDMGYLPSQMARSLRNKRTKTIGLIVPDIANPFFAEIAKGVEDAGFAGGYTVSLCNSNMTLQRELAYLERLQTKGVDGIIFIAATAQINHIRPLIDRGLPVIMFYRDSGGLKVDTFKVDNIQMGYTATKHLLELGHRDIACIQPASPQTPSQGRIEGFRRALTECGLRANPTLMVRGNNLLSGGREAALKLVQDGAQFTAIFAGNDAMAIGAMRALRSGGYRIPEDVSVVGVDDITLASYAEPPLTTIAQPKQEAGTQAVRCLIERIEGNYEGGPRRIALDTHIIVRESTSMVKDCPQNKVRDVLHNPQGTPRGLPLGI
jgi:LacI family transcriptional regulator